MMGQQPQTESLFYLSLPKTQLADHYTMPVASRVKCRAAGVLHGKLDFALQTGIRLVLHSHASLEARFDQAPLRV